MNKNFKNMSIGAIASVIAGAYYLYGSKEGQAKRKQIAAWSVKMKGEVLHGIEKMKEVTGPMYEKIVQEVASKYKKVKNIDAKDVEAEINSLKKHWKDMSKPVVKKVKKALK
jgi:hypothetical protein